jgi:predicted ribosome quality control (RQC) complex YloA/Tae2 family protein
MDNFLLQAIVTELEALLIGQRLGRVAQLGVTDLAIDFRLRDGRRLLIATDPQRLAVYLTARSLPQLGDEARTDTGFVALIKKYLGGARLVGLEKLGYDRVISFAFVAEDEAGVSKQLTLVVLLTGRAANVLLLEDERVLAALREREEPLTAFIEPAPPAAKLDPFQCASEKLTELIALENGDVAAAAQKYLLGFTPVYARELAWRAQTTAPDRALHSLLNDLFETAPRPTIYAAPALADLRRAVGRDEFNLTLAPTTLEHLSAESHTVYASINEAADVYFTLLDERRRFLALKQKLAGQLNAKLKKLRTLRANLQRELAGFAQAEQQQRYGELLLANLHQAVKAETGFAVTDFYDAAQPIISIPAADKPTAQEAAEHYFKLARKARHGAQTINARLPEIEKEIAALEGRLQQLASIVRADELQQLAVSGGFVAPPQPSKQAAKPRQQKTKEEKLPGVRRYRSSDGFEMLVGRTDRDNDHLTFRLAKSFDLWFHAADYPGSHVVLRNPQRQAVPTRAIIEAAQLAAKFSQARTNTKVAVNYCERKFVSKLKGFAPGQVRLSSFKTILVEPAESGERVL